MEVHKIRRLAVTAIVCAMGAFAGCVVPATEDFSGFDEFEFTRDGFCTVDGTVRSASIQRTETDQYELQLSVLEEGTEGVDDCDPDFAGLGCFVVRDLPARELTPDETEQMLALFRAVSVETVLYYPLCVFPCEIRSARWDDVELTDLKTCTGSAPYRVLGFGQMDKIAAFLGSLAPEVDQ